MSKLIEEAKKISDFVTNSKSELTADPKRILKEAAIRKDGVVVEIPWDTTVDGDYQKTITVVITKVTKEKVYFMNPVKVSDKPCKITETDKLGPPREIGKDKVESMSIADFFKMAKTDIVIGIVSPDAS